MSGFNPRPRAGATSRPAPTPYCPVSIHAPARGATGGRRRVTRVWSSFNPRPRAGGDVPASSCLSIRCGFNPRPRAGGDKLTKPRLKPSHVSIHAPARGATRHCSSFPAFACGFNPRPRAGGDAGPRSGFATPSGFNPRPRAGGDLPGQRPNQKQKPVSIHAPARGATAKPCWNGSASVPFQSTPPRGGRPARPATRSRPPCFNPRPRAGGDAVAELPVAKLACFNPRPRAGGDGPGG